MEWFPYYEKFPITFTGGVLRLWSQRLNGRSNGGTVPASI
jgi:hypothetical protein